MKNKPLSPYKKQKLIEAFCDELTATQAAHRLNLDRNTINKYYKRIREHIAAYREYHKMRLLVVAMSKPGQQVEIVSRQIPSMSQPNGIGVKLMWIGGQLLTEPDVAPPVGLPAYRLALPQMAIHGDEEDIQVSHPYGHYHLEQVVDEFHSGAVRNNGQTYYLDRNFLITNAAATNTDVQLFFTNAEFEDLQDADLSIITLADLKVTRTAGTTCVLNFAPVSPALLNQTGNGASAFAWIQFNTPSLGNFFIHGGLVALPINLVSFEGVAMIEYNKLMWFTENEINFDQFEIQRASSTTGQFTTIGSVKGGHRSGGDYFFEDKQPLSSGFYRLKMMDIDGQFTYSKVISIKRAGTAFAIRNVFPNPTTDFVNVELTSPSKMEIDIRLMDISGKEIRAVQTSLSEGDQTIIFSLEGIQPGTYFLNVLGQVSKVIRL